MPTPGQQSKATDSFEGGLANLYTDIANLALAPDSAPHQQFIQTMMQGVLKYRQLVQQQKAAAAAHTQQMVAGQAAGLGGSGAGGPPGGGPPGMGGPPGQPPGGGGGPDQGAPPPQQIAHGGGPGMSGYGGVASPDDLQRILAGAGGQ
jgi:hypothetical protein